MHIRTGLRAGIRNSTHVCVANKLVSDNPTAQTNTRHPTPFCTCPFASPSQQPPHRINGPVRGQMPVRQWHRTTGSLLVRSA